MSVYSEYIYPQKASIRARENTQHAQSGMIRKKTSIQKKFLLLCILLVTLMAVSISTAYFVMTKRDKELQSQQRIQIAFDMLRHDMRRQIQALSKGFEEFLNDSKSIQGAAYTYASNMTSPQVSKVFRSIGLSYLLNVTDELKQFAHIVSADRVIMYGADASILAMYQNESGEETVGLSTISDAGNQTYLSLDDYSEASKMMSGSLEIPDRLFPFGVPTHFYGDIPEAASVDFFTENGKLGIRITAPIYYFDEEIIGVLTGDIFYTQEWIEQYAALSQTNLSLFIDSQLSIGSSREHNELIVSSTDESSPVTMSELLDTTREPDYKKAVSVNIKGEEHYQGCFQMVDEYDIRYTFTASVSKDREDRAIRKVLIIILTISASLIGGAFVISFFLSRKSMQALHDLVTVIGYAASGNLSQTAPVTSLDEFGILAVKLNGMISRLRDVSTQTKAVSQNVTSTSESILHEVEMLFSMMEQQVNSLDNTTEAVEGIDRFIDMVVANIAELLERTEHILQSIHTMGVTTEHVTMSTVHLNDNLQDISAFSERVSQASKHVVRTANRLLDNVQETEQRIQLIGHLLLDVEQNADQSRQLARETVDVALKGQTAVKSSIEGVITLKEVVAKSAHIMHTVNTRSEEVSRILDFVDEIAERTGLLSLNASIISAQAGRHGQGFAVIADEIRELSTQTKNSTKEIYKVISSLRRESAEGVKSVTDGIHKAEQGIELAEAARKSLDAIIERARFSSQRAFHTVQVVQETVESGEIIQKSMDTVAAMTAEIQGEIQKEEQDLQQVVAAIENIYSMSEQVKDSNLEQYKAAAYVEQQMEIFTQHLNDISGQTQQLQQSSDQIVDAMRKIEAITGDILHDTTALSEHTITSLVQQSEALRQGLNVFQVE